MRFRAVPICLAVVALLAGMWSGSNAPAQAENEGVQVLPRGPVHEAFATPLTDQPRQPPVINQKVPAPVEEIPPDQKLTGNNVQWIPGYWAWDDDGGEFIWVSGLWRDIPPGQVWVPGYWVEVQGGITWVAGYWAPASTTEVQYLPEPPESLENGPSTAAPDANHCYVPGIWIYVDNRYAWRPGFWNRYYAGWFWMPARYCWTPAGYVFHEGFYDYAPHRRAVLFAPVRFAAGWGRPGWFYRPHNVILEAGLIASLFIRPDWGGYYYGDYFGDRYYGRGYRPWVDYRIGRSVYDPLFANYRLQYRDPDRWERSLRTVYTERRTNPDARPIVMSEAKAGARAQVDNRIVVAPITQVEQSVKLQKVSGKDEAKISQQWQSLRDQRKQVEADVATKGPAKSARTAKLTLPKAAVAAQGQVQTPPLPKTPKQLDKPEPKTPKQLDKPEPKFEPKGKFEPKSAPKAEPKVEPKSAPKAEPKSAPKAEPKVEPKSAPKAEPKGGPPPKDKDEPKRKAKDKDKD